MQTIRKMICALGLAIIMATSSMAAGTLGDLSPEELEAEIRALTREYTKKLLTGHDDLKLKKLIRETSEAFRDGNYDKVRELLSKWRKSGAVSKKEAKDLIDKLTGQADKPERASKTKVTLERIKLETMPGLYVEVMILKPVINTARVSDREQTINGILSGDKDAEPEKKKPTKPQKFPAILFSHGGTRGMPSGYLNLARHLALEGYIVYAPLFRGQGNSDGKFEYATGELVDLFVTYAALKDREDVDVKRLALVGGGHGGLLTLIALASMEDIACAAVISTPTDLETLVLRERVFRMQFDKNPGLLSSRDFKALRARSPIYLAPKITTPLMMLHGGSDKYIPSSYAKGFESVMKSLDKENLTLKIYKGVNHMLYARYAIYDNDLMDFLSQKLKPINSKTKKPAKRPTQKTTTPK